jgi:NADH-quinone oxidoreductase subunit M
MVNFRRIPIVPLILLTIVSLVTAFLPPQFVTLGLMVVPLIGVIVGALLPRHIRGKTWGLAVSASTLFAAIGMALRYNWARGGFQFVVEGPGLEQLGIHFSFGVDQISLMLVLLTAALHPLAVTASLRSVHRRTREHYAWMNLLLITMLGTFLATDLLIFYAFFEVSLVPLFFIVGIWGGNERRYAAAKLFLYTFAASLPALASIVYLGVQAGTFDIGAIATYAQHHMSTPERFWVLMGLLLAFAVKTPLVPLHTWLPLAHTEAPTAGSVDLAALVLKLGTYGLLRIALPIGLITTDGQVLFPWVLQILAILCLIAIIYAALVAWVQRDIKRIIAYSSVSHMGFCVLGMLALNLIGLQGSVLYMINHGITSGALFLVVGMIYHRYHTRDIDELSGLGRAMPRLSFFTVVFVLGSIGLPGSNGFASEFLTILGAFTSEHLGIVYGVIAATGIVLGAIYMLHFTARLLFGPLRYRAMHVEVDSHETVHPKYVTGGDITGREVLILTPLALAVVVLGILPAPVLRSLERPCNAIRNYGGMVAQAHPQTDKPEPPAPAIALAQAQSPK